MSRGGGGAWQRDFGYRPRDIVDAVDPGVHPAVAKMRLEAAGQKRTLHDCMVGRTPMKILGQQKAPGFDLGKTLSDPTYNPKNFFKQASNLGVNPLAELTKGDTVQPPDEKASGAKAKDIDKKQSSSSSASEEEKKNKKKKKKKNKQKIKKKKKKTKSTKKKQSSSSSSESEQSCKFPVIPPQMVGATIVLDSDNESRDGVMREGGANQLAEAEREPLSECKLDLGVSACSNALTCPIGHKLGRVVIGKATSGHRYHRCDLCRVSSKTTGARRIYRCGNCNYDMCAQCHAKMRVSGAVGESVQAKEDKLASEAVNDDKLHSEALDEERQNLEPACDPYEHHLDEPHKDAGTSSKRSHTPDQESESKTKKICSSNEVALAEASPVQESNKSMLQSQTAELQAEPPSAMVLDSKRSQDKIGKKKVGEKSRMQAMQISGARATSFCGSW